MTSRHVIDRQRIDLVCDSEEAALALRARLDGVVESRWQPAIRRVFDEFASGEGRLVVDRLSVDLGPMRVAEFDAVSERRLVERLREALERALRHVDAPQAEEAVAVDLVVHYLRWGTLPFWADQRGFVFGPAFSAALDADPAGLAGALRRYGAQVVERLVLQLDDEAYRAAVRLLSPRGAAEVLAWGDELLAAHGPRLSGALRWATLGWLLGPEPAFERRSSVERLVAGVAERSGAPRAELLAVFETADGEQALRPEETRGQAALADPGTGDRMPEPLGSEGAAPTLVPRPLALGDHAGVERPGSGLADDVVADRLAELVSLEGGDPAVVRPLLAQLRALRQDARAQRLLAGLSAPEAVEGVVEALHAESAELAVVRQLLAELSAPEAVEEMVGALHAEGARPTDADTDRAASVVRAQVQSGVPPAGTATELVVPAQPTEGSGRTEPEAGAPGIVPAPTSAAGELLTRLRVLLAGGHAAGSVASLLDELLAADDPAGVAGLRSLAGEAGTRAALALAVEPAVVDRVAVALHPAGAQLVELRHVLAGLPAQRRPPAAVIADALLAEATLPEGRERSAPASVVRVLRAVFGDPLPGDVADLADQIGSPWWKDFSTLDGAAAVATVEKVLASGDGGAASLRSAAAEPRARAWLAGALPVGVFDRIVRALWPSAGAGLRALRRLLEAMPAAHRPAPGVVREALLAGAARSAGIGLLTPAAFGRILADAVGQGPPPAARRFLAAEARTGGGGRMNVRDAEAFAAAVGQLAVSAPRGSSGHQRHSEVAKREETAMAEPRSVEAAGGGDARTGGAGVPVDLGGAYPVLDRAAAPFGYEVRTLAECMAKLVGATGADGLRDFLFTFGHWRRGEHAQMEALAVAFFAWRGREVGGGAQAAASLFERLVETVESPTLKERLMGTKLDLLAEYVGSEPTEPGEDDDDADEWTDPNAPRDEAAGPFNVANAGLVLLHPFLPRAFEYWGMPGDPDQQRSWPAEKPELAGRIVHLLQYCVDGRLDAPEPQLVLNKMLTGLPATAPVPASIDEDDDALDVCEEMLVAVLNNWDAMEGTSLNGLQETFLQREGRLQWQDDHAWHLKVQRKTVDVLLDQIPWGFQAVYHPWMAAPVMVAW